MPQEKDKLFIKVGQNFEANATGRLAISIVFILACLLTVSAFI